MKLVVGGLRGPLVWYYTHPTTAREQWFFMSKAMPTGA
jgi:hypothetical protein